MVENSDVMLSGWAAFGSAAGAPGAGAAGGGLWSSMKSLVNSIGAPPFGGIVPLPRPKSLEHQGAVYNRHKPHCNEKGRRPDTDLRLRFYLRYQPPRAGRYSDGSTGCLPRRSSK